MQTPPPPTDAHEPEPGVVSLRRRLLPLGLLALALGVGIVGWLVRSGGPGGTRTERMEAALRDLAARDPGTWRAITLIPRPDLEAARPPTGAGLRVVAPRDGVLEMRPRTRWSGVPLEARVEVTLRRDGGSEPLWRASGQGRFVDYPPQQPPLEGGVYQVELRVGPDGAPTSASFWLPDMVARLQWDELAQALRARAPADVRTLLLAHVAARQGYLLEAERLAQEALREDARNDDALLLLRWVHTQLGESEGYESAR